MNRGKAVLAFAIAFFGVSSLVHADDSGSYSSVDGYEEYGQRIHDSETISPLGDEFFGDSVNLYNGQTSFEVTDVSIPGNSALPVALSRSLAITDRRQMPVNGDGLQGFGDWSFDVPYVDGTFTQQDGWTLYSNPPGTDQRCTDNTDFPYTGGIPDPYGTGTAPYADIWDGNHLHIPGQGDQTLLANTQSKNPAFASAATYKWVTTGNWKLKCISPVTNMSGQGFVAVSPSGVSYTFNYLAKMTSSVYAFVYDSRFHPIGVPRWHMYLLATQVTDRFGNWVKYSYTTDSQTQYTELTGITSSDGRSITVNWQGNEVTSVTSALGTWQYAYRTATWTDKNGGHHSWPYLSTVQRPDGSRWTYSVVSGALITNKESWPDDNHPNPPLCQGNAGPGDPNTGSFVYQIGAPSGATGLFDFEYARHYRDKVPIACVGGGAPDDENYPQHVYIFLDNFSLVSKQISGPGLPTDSHGNSLLKWTYNYGDESGDGSYYEATAPYAWTGNPEPYIPPGPCTTCGSSKTVTVSGPTSIIKYTYGTVYANNEGQLLDTEVDDLSGHPLKTITNAYVSDTDAPNELFANIAGYDLSPNYQNPMGNRNRPVVSTQITQDGLNFTTTVNNNCAGSLDCFDVFARSTSERETGSSSRTVNTRYYDDLTHWVVGQVASTAVNSPANACAENDTTLMSCTTYDTNTALPLKTYAFGKRVSTKAWHSNDGTDQAGTLNTITDGNTHTTTLSSWKRGIPRTITYADTRAQTAVVNDAGWITSVTDETTATTGYQYDEMGRLSEIDYPNDSNNTWNATSIAFGQVTQNTEYGIEPGHWKQIVHTGQGYTKTYFDALWRPLVTEHFDNTDETDTLSQTVTRYDAGGRKAFESYPLRNPSLSYLTANTGTRTFYDALDRITEVDQDSELNPSVLKTFTQYLPGFETKVIDPRGYATTTDYMTYATPTTQWPTDIKYPENEQTLINRDVYGKPLSVNRTNIVPPRGEIVMTGAPSITRYYVYDSNQLLCERIDPESGLTVLHYDLANNLDWSASGLAVPQTPNCTTDRNGAAASPHRVSRTYYPRNWLNTLSFSDGKGNQTWLYYPDGLPQQVTTNNVTTSGQNPVVNAYVYDPRRLLTGESVSQPNIYTWSVGYGYDVNGKLASMVYPDGSVANYAPNALGQPTQVSNQITGVSYFPDGKVYQFAYANGLVHTLTENVRDLPSHITDTGAGVTALDQAYTYDEDGDPKTINDAATTQQNRSMTYDGQDRLLTGTVAYQGSTPTNYSYDLEDNLAQLVFGTRVRTYNYDETNRLMSVTDTGASDFDLAWDDQGNLASRGGVAYTFDYGNRLRDVGGQESYFYDGLGRRVQATASANGQSILSMYTRGGQLIYQDDERASTRHVYLYLGTQLLGVVDHGYGGGNAVRYQHADVQGSIVAQTNNNATPGIIERSVYSSWGAPLNHDNEDEPGYNGHVQDSLTGLTYMQQRYYDPVLERFLSVDPVNADADTGANYNRYWYANDNPYRYVDPDGRCADHYKDGSCEVQVAGDLKKDKLALAAQKSLEAVLNAYDKSINALDDSSNISIKDSSGKVIGSIGGKEFKAIWNGTHFTVTNDVPSNGGVGGGTGGTWHGDSFSGDSVLSPRAVFNYTNSASLRNESSSIGASTLTFHELAHETHFGEALTGQYPVEPSNWGNKAFEENFWNREKPTSSAGESMAGAAGAPFDCSLPGGCQ